MADLRGVGVSIVTVGQYLRPSRDHLPVSRYWTPEEFDRLRGGRGRRWAGPRGGVAAHPVELPRPRGGRGGHRPDRPSRPVPAAHDRLIAAHSGAPGQAGPGAPRREHHGRDERHREHGDGDRGEADGTGVTRFPDEAGARASHPAPPPSPCAGRRRPCRIGGGDRRRRARRGREERQQVHVDAGADWSSPARRRLGRRAEVGRPCAPGTAANGPELTISPAWSECCAARRKTCAPTGAGKRTRRSCTSLWPPESCHTRS